MTESRLPFVFRFASILLAIVLLCLLLYLGQQILAPIALSAFLAVLLQPVVGFLVRRRIPRILAILIALTAMVLAVAGVAVFFSVQVANFVEEWPRLEGKINSYVADLQNFVEKTFDIPESKQIQLLKEGAASAAKAGAGTIGTALLAFSSVALNLILIPLYIFLILYYRDLWIEFFFRITSRKEHGKVGAILQEAGGTVQAYLTGLTIETFIIIALNITALLLLGIDYAIMFGVLAGVLNLIPYIGIIIGSILPMLMALITKDSVWYAVGVAGAFTVIQFIDNNLVVPLIVGGRVKVNSLVAIVALLVGAVLWGIIGMFLSLPIVAIMKVIFDRVDGLKPWGLILGDEIPERSSSSRKP